MRQATAEPRASIYQRYQVFAPWLPSAHPTQPRQRVVIAGSGPAGLVAAAVLSLSLTQDFVRPLYHWRSLRSHAYRRSMLNSAGDDDALLIAGPAHDAPPQNLRLGADDFLPDHLGGGRGGGVGGGVGDGPGGGGDCDCGCGCSGASAVRAGRRPAARKLRRRWARG